MPFAGGDGSVKNPYLIETCAQFNQIRCNLHAHYRLTSNLNFRKALGELSWIPIGQYNSKPSKIDPEIPIDEQDLSDIEDFGFTGELDGGNHTISEVNCFWSKKMWVGLFGACGGAYIHNLNAIHFRIGSLTKSCIVGTIAGTATDSLFERCTIKKATVYSGLVAGGISGDATGSNYSQCQFQGEIMLNNSPYSCAGGLVGGVTLSGGKPPYYQDCCVNAKICGADFVGGITNWDAIISRCFFSGSLSGVEEVSGIVSAGMLSVVQNCVCSDCEIIYIGKGPVSYQHSRFITYCDELGKEIGSEHIQDAWVNHVGMIRCDDHLLRPVLDTKNNYCSESAVLRTLTQIIPSIDGSRRDGITIPEQKANSINFYQEIGWDFDTIWEIGPDQLPRIKTSI